MRYRTVVVDPPWETMGGPLVGGVGEHFKFNGTPKSRPLPYPSMTVKEIMSLALPTISKDAALYLWTVNGHLEDAYRVARVWGFKPSTLCVWAKNPMGGGLGGAFGISTEFFLYARRGSPPEKRETGTWWNWKRHYINGKPAHSAKPDAFYDLVQRVSDGPYLELFARRNRLGWDTWGNEALQHVEVPDHNKMTKPR